MDQHEARRDDEKTVRVPERVDLIDHRYDAPQDERRAAGPATVPQGEKPQRSESKLVFWLFIATCVSTFVAQAWRPVLAGILRGESELVLTGLQSGLVFSVCLMSILFAHEMGHYLQSRRHRVPASLPYFIPMPISPLGTMGAVIIQRGLPDRKQWFDIAISGPLAGLVIALPLMYYGVVNSKVVNISPFMGEPIYGNPPLLEWIVAFVHEPLQPGRDIYLTPVLFAAWVGVFITALNLIPIGQLDGGHILYCLIGRRAHPVALVLLGAAIAYMFYTGNYSYSLIVILLLLMGPRHPPTANDRVPLGWPRIVLGWLTLGFIFIGFTPTPILVLEPNENMRQRPPVRRPSDLVVRVDANTTIRPDPLQSVGPAVFVPEGRLRIAQRFIAGTTQRNGVRSPGGTTDSPLQPSRRDSGLLLNRLSSSELLSYCRLSLRDKATLREERVPPGATALIVSGPPNPSATSR